ncbi:prephenate dehydrogenase [uncultured Dokdonia sp.]|uniref:prephenate dehydrogenase n=1 Tax=uncultured Dokdonia sp. TaxID=575653 RepID=UPI00262C644E|nr:prephenate dehydrogenase [uncultured Dokdonia sp.]
MEKIYIIGIGLIGGSFARDLRKIYPKATFFGIDTTPLHITEAVRIGLIDEEATISTIEDADMVVLSIPVDIALEVLPKVLDQINDQTLVIDMGSTKASICEVVATHERRRNFLACHPIAGTEFSGPMAAIEGLYKGKTNIICEVEKTSFKLQEKALQLFTSIGMRIRYMDPVSHDKHIAYVSHLSHISAFMLGKTVIDKEKNERDIFDMAGSGFASTVRLAKSNPTTWTSIFKQNKDNILETLDEYMYNLAHFKKLMQEDNFTGVFEEMENTNHIKEILKGIE